jgi:predicted permease
MLSDLRYRLRALFSHRAIETEMGDELRFHIERQAEKYIARGMTPEEAARRARLEFGGEQQIREECRDARGTRWIDDLFRDVRYALRGFRQSPVFAAVAVLSLALGIGANTAIFSVLDALLLKPLPVREPASLVALGQMAGDYTSSYALWRQIRQHQDVCSETFAYSTDEFDLAAGGEKQPVRGLYVSGDYFSALGVPARLGRVLEADDDRRGGPPVAVLNYDFWRNRYGADPDIAGRVIRLDNRPFLIVGVAARGFFGMDVGDRFDVAIPVSAEPLMHPQRVWMDEPDVWWLTVVGRLKPGADLARAAARLNVLGPGMYKIAVPDNQHDPGHPYFVLYPAATGLSDLREEGRDASVLLMAMVGLVLLIACANIANLLLARAGARSREVAVRLALGASRGRLIRQFLTESVLLSLTGAALGVLFARFAAGALVAWISASHNARFLDLSPDLRIIGFIAALAVLTGLLFGLAPALRATRVVAQPALKEGGRGLAGSRRNLGLGRALVVSQVALSLVLLVGAGLFVRSLGKLLGQDAGFRRENILLVEPDLRAARYSRARESTVYADLLDRLRHLPGVISAARSVVTPISGRTWQWQVGVSAPGGERRIHSFFNLVSPGFLRTMGTPLLAGRDFTDADRAGAPFVALVNETAASRLFPGVDPIGQVYSDLSPDRERIAVQVVGLVKDAKYRSLREEPRPTIYIPIAQPNVDFQVNGFYEVRFAGPLSDVTQRVRAAFHDADPRIGLQLQLLTTQIDDSLLKERLVARLSSFFGVLALLLVSIGLYGVVAYSVMRRRNEIGVRMALGATRGGVVRLVLRETVVLLAIGIPLGLAAAFACGRLVRSMLFALTPGDPPTLAGACVLLVFVGLAGALIPARRAALLDPLVTLREE